MGNYIPATDVDRNHLGKTLRISIPGGSVEDRLQAVTHEAALISEGSLFERPRLTTGRISTTLKFLHFGEVDFDDEQMVRIVD